MAMCCQSRTDRPVLNSCTTRSLLAGIWPRCPVVAGRCQPAPLLDALTDDNVESSSPAAGIRSRWGCTRRACVSVLLADLSVAHDQPGKETDVKMHTKCRNYHIVWCKIEDRATGLRPEPGDTLRTPVPFISAVA